MDLIELIDQRLREHMAAVRELEGLRAAAVATGARAPAPALVTPPDPAAMAEMRERLSKAAAGPEELQMYRDDKEHVPPGERHGGSAPAGKPLPADAPDELKRVRLAAILVAGRQPETAVADRAWKELGLPQSNVLALLNHDWFQGQRRGRGFQWSLTELGRAALASSTTAASAAGGGGPAAGSPGTDGPSSTTPPGSDAASPST